MKDRQVCPLCGVRAVVPLTKELLRIQPDETTHVCHPALGGCNYGFEATTVVRDAETGEVLWEMPREKSV